MVQWQRGVRLPERPRRFGAAVLNATVYVTGRALATSILNGTLHHRQLDGSVRRRRFRPNADQALG